MRMLSVGKYFNIPVYIHWTFSFIILLVGYEAYKAGMNQYEVLAFASYIFCVFLCVVLHEYGHALMARRFGIGTQDILITPIGGLARLYGLPQEPKGELYIAFAGPLVNLAIAISFFLGLYFSGVFLNPLYIDIVGVDLINTMTSVIGFLHLILFLNIVLFTFNMIPAFPMDGGRILRALLSFKLDRVKATFYASIVGRVMAIAFVAFASYNRLPGLFFIGIFIFLMAGREYRMVERRGL